MVPVILCCLQLHMFELLSELYALLLDRVPKNPCPSAFATRTKRLPIHSVARPGILWTRARPQVCWPFFWPHPHVGALPLTRKGNDKKQAGGETTHLKKMNHRGEHKYYLRVTLNLNPNRKDGNQMCQTEMIGSLKSSFAMMEVDHCYPKLFWDSDAGVR